ncbi:MAG: GEVED domain-containing protein, partial [Methylophagaceae bacterium]
MKRILLLFLIIFSYTFTFGQATACDPNIPEICSVSSYPASVSGTASAPGGSFDCTGNTISMNPAFFYLEAGTTGPLNIDMDPVDITGNPLTNDLDFICWGPFSNTANMCNSLTTANIQDCSYSAASSETCNIANAIAGQFYVILVSNWTSGTAAPCFIEFTPDSPLAGGGFAGDNNTINPCSTEPPFNLITGLNNQPDNHGFWVNSSNNSIDSIFDPSIDTSGVYIYIIPGSTNCPGDTAWLTVNLLNGANISITSASNSCSGDNPLTLTANPSGGVFSGNNVSGGAFSPDISVIGLNQITYIYQANGCTDTAFQNITVNESPTVLPADELITNPLCYGEATGTAIITATGGTPGYSLNWYGQDPMALPSGIFNYTVSDINACAFSGNVSVFDPPNNLGILTAYNSYCYGTDNGSIGITLNANGNGDPSDTISGLLYCASHPSLNPGIPATSTVAIIEEVLLFGDNNDINNNTAGIADSYQDYTTQMHADVTQGQFYNISITLNGIGAAGASQNKSGAKVYIDYNQDGDFNGVGEEIGIIPYRNNTNIGVPEIINFQVPSGGATGTGATRLRVVSQFFNVGSPTSSPIGPCDAPDASSWMPPYGGATEDYTIVLKAASATADYLWDNGQITDSITGLNPGTYTVTITPSSGCAAQDSAVVLEPEEINFNPTITQISCNTFSDGQVVLNPEGGNGGFYTIDWGTANPLALGDGSYLVTVSDLSTITTTNLIACENQTTIIMVEPPEFEVDFTISSNEICLNDPITLDFDFNQGGAPNFMINYTENANPISAGPFTSAGQQQISVTPNVGNNTYIITSIT